jgi:hypothetical protein
MNWTKLNYPEEGTVVWVVDMYNDIQLATWDGESWSDTDGDTVYTTVVAWAEIDYAAIKQEWNKA